MSNLLNEKRAMWFVGITKKQIKILRQATEQEIEWYKNLSKDLAEYSNNVEHFERVNTTFGDLEKGISNNTENSFFDYERVLKGLVANFLYAFNECLDHWESYIKRDYGKDSDFYKSYKTLTANAYDQNEEYKITYGLRNFQHSGKVLHGVSIYNGQTHIFSNRDKLLSEGKFTVPQKEALKRQNKKIELFPIFAKAKMLLEKINIKLIFYPVTPKLEQRVIDALEKKKKIFSEDGALLIANFVDSKGNHFFPNIETLQMIHDNGQKWILNYDEEVDWGICNLIKFNKGIE